MLRSCAEQLDERATSRSDRVAGLNRGLGLDIEHELVEVSALAGAGGVDAVADLEDRRVDRVDRNLTGLGVLVAVLRCRNVATATLDRQLELKLRTLAELGDDQLGVVHLDTGGSRNVCSGHISAARLAKVGGDGLVVLARNNEFLDVQDDLGDIFANARDSAELVQHAVNTDAGDCRARNRRKQAPTKRVADGVPEAGLERLNDEPATELGDLFLSERGTVCNQHSVFLSIK